MNAKEARAIVETRKSEDDILSNIYKLIETKSKAKENFLTLDEWHKYYPSKEVVEELKRDGYEIRYYGGGSFDTPADYTISW